MQFFDILKFRQSVLQLKIIFADISFNNSVNVVFRACDIQEFHSFNHAKDLLVSSFRIVVIISSAGSAYLIDSIIFVTLLISSSLAYR